MTKTLAVFAVLAAAWLVSAWTLMLIVDVIHARWIPQLPTISFPVSLGVSALLMLRNGSSTALALSIRSLGDGKA